jgi:hypothetical protein
MFSEALERVSKYTLPVIFSRKFRRGNVSSGLGTFIIINRDGWILTADHIVAEIAKFEESQVKMAEYDQQKKNIMADASLKEKEKHRRIQRLQVSDEWIIAQAVFWADPKWRIETFVRWPLADIALGQIKGFDATALPEYPVFKNPAEELKMGTSICRLGYPFHEIKATFIESSGQFELDQSTFPVPRFPNDGILTRFVAFNSQDGSDQAIFVETSTAGLRGQSGGPIFDREARICAIQSRTNSLPLGFSPSIKQGSREYVEHQFIHLGWGTHVKHCIKLMRDNHVSFRMDPP